MKAVRVKGWGGPWGEQWGGAERRGEVLCGE